MGQVVLRRVHPFTTRSAKSFTMRLLRSRAVSGTPDGDEEVEVDMEMEGSAPRGQGSIEAWSRGDSSWRDVEGCSTGAVARLWRSREVDVPMTLSRTTQQGSLHGGVSRSDCGGPCQCL